MDTEINQNIIFAHIAGLTVQSKDDLYKIFKKSLLVDHINIIDVDTITNKIIEDNNFKKYLEIGVRRPEDCFDRIKVEVKHSVDPGFENESNDVTYPYTSDDFFNRLEWGKLDLDVNHSWDVIFIDGLHISYQVERDVLNSLLHLSENGFILLHDCNPFLYEYNYERVIEDYWGQGWNGTVWKVIYKLLCFRINFRKD